MALPRAGAERRLCVDRTARVALRAVPRGALPAHAPASSLAAPRPQRHPAYPVCLFNHGSNRWGGDLHRCGPGQQVHVPPAAARRRRLGNLRLRGPQQRYRRPRHPGTAGGPGIEAMPCLARWRSTCTCRSAPAHLCSPATSIQRRSGWSRYRQCCSSWARTLVRGAHRRFRASLGRRPVARKTPSAASPSPHLYLQAPSSRSGRPLVQRSRRSGQGRQPGAGASGSRVEGLAGRRAAPGRARVHRSIARATCVQSCCLPGLQADRL